MFVCCLLILNVGLRFWKVGGVKVEAINVDELAELEAMEKEDLGGQVGAGKARTIPMS